MKKIEPLQLEKFNNMLDEVEKLFPLNRANIEYGLNEIQKSNFPAPGSSVMITAMNEDMSMEFLPFAAVVMTTAAPHHLSEHAGVLELKIMDSLLKEKGIEFIAWLSVFPSGRMIFGMNGAQIDSNGKNISVDESIVQRDDQFYGDKKIVRLFRKAMISAFTSKEPAALEAKAKVLKAIEMPLPDNN